MRNYFSKKEIIGVFLMRNILLALITACFSLSSCVASAVSGEKKPSINDDKLKKDATEYTLLVAKARLIQKRCPDLQLKVEGLMAAIRQYPSVATAPSAEDLQKNIDMNVVVAGIGEFEASNRLRGASQKIVCQFGRGHISRNTAVGQLLMER